MRARSLIVRHSGVSPYCDACYNEFASSIPHRLAQVPANATKGSLRALKKDQLVSILCMKGLSDAGLKPELVDRLHAALQQSEAPATAESESAAAASEARGNATAANRPSAAVRATAVPATDAASVAVNGAAAASAPGNVAAPAVAVAPAAAAADANAPAAAAAAVAAAVQAGAPEAAVPVRRRALPAAFQQQQRRQQPAPECHVPTGLAVQWLGTSSGAPTQHRNVSSILLLRRTAALMVDCGEGTINQLAAAGVDPILVKGCGILAVMNVV